MGMCYAIRLGLKWLIIILSFLFFLSASVLKFLYVIYVKASWNVFFINHTLGSITIAIELMFLVYLLIVLVVPKFT